MALLSKFFGRTASEGAAFSFGLATGPVLYPAVREIESLAWKQYQSRPVDAGTAAAIVAEDVEQEAWGENEAASNGISRDRFAAIVGEALNAPGVPELLTLRRRGEISDADLTHGLRKAKLELRWDAPLKALADVLLSPQELANARQQGYIDQARQQSEAALQGVNSERAEIQYELVGLPPGHAEAQSLLNRGLFDEATFAQAIREGHTKTKYTDVLLQAARRLLTPTEWVDAHLRGHATEAEMYAGTAAHGVTKADTDVLFQSHGRALTTHQITTGLARGGTFNGPTDQIPEAYLSALRQGSIQPPYYNLDYANRHTLPSFFVVRALIQDRKLTQAQGEDLFLQEGWPPELAKLAAEAYAPTGTAAKSDPWVVKAEGQLWTSLHKDYVKTGLDRAQVEPALTMIVSDQQTRDTIFSLWETEKTTAALQPPAA